MLSESKQYALLESLLFPLYHNRVEQLISSKNKFMHYTKFDAVKGILESKELWLKSVSSQDDEQEVEYCATVLTGVLREDAELRKRLCLILQLNVDCNISEGYPLDCWVMAVCKKLKEDVYISCFSEDRQANGRGIMWNKYAKENGGALVFDFGEFFTRHKGNAWLYDGLYFSPVEYLECDELIEKFRTMINNLWEAREELKQCSPELVKNRIVYAFIYAMVSIKQVEYRYEHEWRLVAIRPREKCYDGYDEVWYKNTLFKEQIDKERCMLNYLEEIMLNKDGDYEENHRSLTKTIEEYPKQYRSIKVRGVKAEI